MRLRQWDVLGAVNTIKDVMQLLGGRVVRCLYVYVKITSNDDLAFVQRKALKVLGEFNKELTSYSIRPRPVKKSITACPEYPCQTRRDWH